MSNESMNVVPLDTASIPSWPEPQSLVNSYEPEVYPVDALPDSIKAAVKEVQGFVRAPMPLVASSALCALSLAIQARVDVRRADKLDGPCSLFGLMIADSGERKSSCDGFFTKAIRDYEMEQEEAAKPKLKQYDADVAAWESKKSGIKDKIRQLAKASKPTDEHDKALRDLEQDKPEPPRVPRLMYADATPEALAYALKKKWPSGGVVSSEAGVVFGSHGMSKDSVMRNLSMLNQLWDGSRLSIDRRTSESFTVSGARLTMALQVQESVLREFFNKTGALARGSGFLARFLVAWPESTQGSRFYTEPPTHWPSLTAFNQRLKEILTQPAPVDDKGELTPKMLELSSEAKTAWIEFHNNIERELSNGKALYDVRDVASKAADNATRLAALFHMFDHGANETIGANSFESASRIVAWHLQESRRFFGELALPAELADAVRLDAWLIDYCKREGTGLAGKSIALQYGPLRKKEKLDSAINELYERDRLRVFEDGKRITLAINPALLA